jgi:hypothetical protein
VRVCFELSASGCDDVLIVRASIGTVPPMQEYGEKKFGTRMGERWCLALLLINQYALL